MGGFNFDENEFERIKEEAEKFYKSICSIHCPYFGEKHD